MAKKYILAIRQCLVFLIISSILFGFHYILKDFLWMPNDFRIHILIFVLTLIVVVSISLFYSFGSEDKIGFVYLGFVIFKMFGMSYLAVFQNDFKNNILIYFGIFWIYLTIETTLILKFLKVNKI